jgi:hypothetical protein
MHVFVSFFLVVFPFACKDFISVLKVIFFVAKAFPCVLDCDSSFLHALKSFSLVFDIQTGANTRFLVGLNLLLAHLG